MLEVADGVAVSVPDIERFLVTDLHQDHEGNLTLIKVPDLNGIHSEILKLINHLISDTLCNIFNICITFGKQPDKSEHAHVLSIFKKGSRLLVSNLHLPKFNYLI